MAKRSFPPLKSNWVFVYWANGHRITAEMLRAYANLEADEVHSTEDSSSVYTYVHLTKQVRQAAIDRFFEKTKVDYDFRLHDMREEGAVGSGGRELRIQEHVGMQMLAKHMREVHENFRPWTSGKEEVTRGLLMQMVGVRVVAARGAAQRLEGEVRTLKRAVAVASEENAGLKAELEERRSEVARVKDLVAVLEFGMAHVEDKLKGAAEQAGREAAARVKLEADNALLKLTLEHAAAAVAENDALRSSLEGAATENAALLAHARELDERVRAMPRVVVDEELVGALANEKAKRRKLEGLLVEEKAKVQALRGRI